nr:transcriptional enhancer factor TEF-5 [Jaculus jaculus]
MSAGAQDLDAPRLHSPHSGSRVEREGPGGPGRGRKGEEIRETSHSGRTRQTGSGQGARSRQGGAGSGAPGVCVRVWLGGRRALGGRGAAPRSLGAPVAGWGALRPVRSSSTGRPVTRHRRVPSTDGSPAPSPHRRRVGSELRLRPRPRWETQITARYPGEGRPGVQRKPPAHDPPRSSLGAPTDRPPPRTPSPPELGAGSGRPGGSDTEPRATSTIASNSWTTSSSPGEAREDGPEGLDKGLDNDAEGVWSPDIEQSFQEALAIYPPCGRRKIILSDEGKMYGRNELIARYIKLRTGKTRTRKQVSSHIQVLARKKVREYQVGIKAMNLDQVSKDKALQSMASMSSAQIVSASVLQNKFSPPSPLPQAVFSTSSRFWSGPPLLGQQPGPSQDIKPFAQPAYPAQPPLPPTLSSYEPLAPLPPAAASAPVWQDRTIASSRLRLLEYSAFMEVQRDPDTYSKHLFVHIGQTNPALSDPPLEAVDVRQIYDKFPEKKGGLKELYEKGPPNAFFLVKFWADLNSTVQEGPGAFYGVSSQYSSADSMTISVSTKVCSFGKQVVEKVETEYARLENGRFVYRIHRSPMCEYMINFIHKLKHLPERYMMNSVLENFTILQVVTSRDSQETLLVIAFVFEVSTSEHGAQHHVYKLVKD